MTALPLAAWAARRRELPCGQRDVLVALCGFVPVGYRDLAWPHLDDLAGACDRPTHLVSAYLADLHRWGYIERDDRASQHRDPALAGPVWRILIDPAEPTS